MTLPPPLTLITFWFDPSDAASLTAFEQLPLQWEGQSIAVDYKPILAAGLRLWHDHPSLALSQLAGWAWLRYLLVASAVQANGRTNRHLTEVILKDRRVQDLPPPSWAATAEDDELILMRGKAILKEAVQRSIQQLPCVTKRSHSSL
jgi:hypothetical protein